MVSEMKCASSQLSENTSILGAILQGVFWYAADRVLHSERSPATRNDRSMLLLTWEVLSQGGKRQFNGTLMQAGWVIL